MKDIPDFNGYSISRTGKILSKKRVANDIIRKRVLRPRYLKAYKDNKRGYLHASLRRGGKSYTKLRHQLVAITYLKNPHEYKFVNHKNGIKTDNRVENLEWCSMEQNTKHATENKLFARGEKAGLSKLTEKEVRKIRRIYKKGDKSFGGKGLGRMFSVDHMTIYAIISNKTWKHV